MAQITMNVGEIQQLVFQLFGDNKITATTAGNTVLLTPEIEYAVNEQRVDNYHRMALNKLCGMFKNTNLMSSDDFAKNKIVEKESDAKKFSGN